VLHQHALNVEFRGILEVNVLIAVKLSLFKNIKDCVVGDSFKFIKYCIFFEGAPTDRDAPIARELRYSRRIRKVSSGTFLEP
jgi:hypothetical protein